MCFGCCCCGCVFCVAAVAVAVCFGGDAGVTNRLLWLFVVVLMLVYNNNNVATWQLLPYYYINTRASIASKSRKTLVLSLKLLCTAQRLLIYIQYPILAMVANLIKRGGPFFLFLAMVYLSRARWGPVLLVDMLYSGTTRTPYCLGRQQFIL